MTFQVSLNGQEHHPITLSLVSGPDTVADTLSIDTAKALVSALEAAIKGDLHPSAQLRR